MSINKRVSETRKILKLTQQEFADTMEISRQSVNNIEKNKHVPGSDLIAKILDKYPNLNARWLLTGEGKMFSREKMPNRVNEPLENYATDYRDKYVQALERENELLREENERLKQGPDKQKAKVG